MMSFLFFFFNDTATTEIYTYGHTLSLHDALPICVVAVVYHPKLWIRGVDRNTPLCSRRIAREITPGFVSVIAKDPINLDPVDSLWWNFQSFKATENHVVILNSPAHEFLRVFRHSCLDRKSTRLNSSN